MEILEVEAFGQDELLTKLRATRLQGFDGFEVYADAHLELVPGLDPEQATPAQRYVLRPNVATVLALRDALLPLGHDIFALEGGLRVRTGDAPDQWMPVLPPVIEESLERDGRSVLLINDGIHRVYAARSVGATIAAVVIRGVSTEYPYYAYALPNGWDGVQPMDELPDVFVKKEYRQPTGYQALFREFNTQFPGVQQVRKQSNPADLKP